MQGARILVAVHEPALRGSLKVALQLAGCLVAEAGNGKEALAILREEPPQLLLLDLEIPAVGSIAILAEMRIAPAHRRPRVITLARLDAIPTVIEAIRLGASDFLIKPLAADDAIASVSSVLDDSPPRDYLTDASLGRIRAALLRGDFGEAEPTLGLPSRNTEAGLFNIAGIVHESHGRLRSARDFYLRAVCADERYQSAWDNLNRLSDLCRYDNRVDAVVGPWQFHLAGAGHA
jgi:DNA-binding response OmpR family regulator